MHFFSYNNKISVKVNFSHQNFSLLVETIPAFDIFTVLCNFSTQLSSFITQYLQMPFVYAMKWTQKTWPELSLNLQIIHFPWKRRNFEKHVKFWVIYLALLRWVSFSSWCLAIWTLWVYDSNKSNIFILSFEQPMTILWSRYLK